jgi:DNA-directed RNA polymerase specialized sigma24 family protein
MRRLLKKVAEWAQTQSGVTPDSEAIKKMRAALEQCLKQYYQDLVFQSVFRDARQQLDPKYRKLLHLHYFLEIDKSTIANELKLPEPEVSSDLETGKRELARAIAIWIQKHCNLPSEVNQLVEKFSKKVPVLIENYPDNIFQ